MQNKNNYFVGIVRIVLTTILLIFGFINAQAQQTNTTQYFYDDNGRLTAVVAPNGETALYDYDAAGNLLAIRRLPAGTLSLFSFSPHEGMPGDAVIFLGSGFVSGQTTILFNGVSAQISESSSSRLSAVIPDGATTGPITLSTPNGSVTTAIPFIIRGMKINPNGGRIYFGDSLQLNAVVYSSTLNSAVRWSVNGIDGGNSTVGMISASGFYLSPNRIGNFTVRATLIEDPTIFAETVIEVRDPNNVQAILNSVSVRRGIPNGKGAISAGVSVQKGGGIGDEFLSQSLSVKRGQFYDSRDLTSLLSVNRGDMLTAETYGKPVSVSKSPFISSITPSTVQKGATSVLTVSGSNLNDVILLSFINATSGAVINNITSANISVNASGDAFTVSLTVPSTIGSGKIIVVASTSSQSSSTTDTGFNFIQIVP